MKTHNLFLVLSWIVVYSRRPTRSQKNAVFNKAISMPRNVSVFTLIMICKRS